MSLKIVQCDGTLSSFCNSIISKSFCNISSLDKVKEGRFNSVVVAELVKLISFSSKREYAIALFKEVLPTLEYGQQFKAVILESYKVQLETKLEVPPQAGDIFAFFEPHIFLNPAFEQLDSAGSRLQPKYLLQTGHESTASLWYTTKQTRHMTVNNTSIPTEDRDLQNNGGNAEINMVNDAYDIRCNEEDMEIFEPESLLTRADTRCNEEDMEIFEPESLLTRADQLIFKIDAFLLKVFPDPSKNPFNLVSGYCVTGCKRIYLHNQVFWKHINKTALCPKCGRTDPGSERELQLMFFMKLRVLYVPDKNADGKNITILAKQSEAEKFLQCSVSEYLSCPAIREGALKMLANLAILNRKRDMSPVPCMKLEVNIVNNVVCVVDIKLQVNTTPLWVLPKHLKTAPC